MSELIRAQRFGVEVEFTGISRAEAVKALAEVLESTQITNPARDCYHTQKVTGKDGRKWIIMRDSSIGAEISHGSTRGWNPDNYKVEFVTPICTYKDLDTIQQIIRKFREKGGKTNASCGIHVHVDGANHTALSLRRLCNFMVARQDIIFEALDVQGRRDHWCRPISSELLAALKSVRDLSRDQMEQLWYGPANDGYTGGINHTHYNPTRYHAVNLHAFFSKGTVEFRLFNSTLHAGKVKAYIQFCLAMSAWAIESKENPNFRKKENLTPAQKVVLMRHILTHRLGLTGEEFQTGRQHLMQVLKNHATEQVAA